MDIEGYEGPALRGAAGLFEGSGPVGVYFEVGHAEQHHLDDLEPLRFLFARGYRLFLEGDSSAPFARELEKSELEHFSRESGNLHENNVLAIKAACVGSVLSKLNFTR